MTFLRNSMNEPQPDAADESATLPVNPFKLAALGQPCVMVDQEGNEHPAIKESGVYRVFKSHGYVEKGSK